VIGSVSPEGDLVFGRSRIAAAQITVHLSTSGGPGGQHANRTLSKVTVSVDLVTCDGISDDVRHRLRRALGDRVRATSSRHRVQARNKAQALENMVERLAAAATPITPRRASRPTKASQTRRLDAKSRRGNIKRARRVSDD
jgi:ribosome-associated protein